MDLDRVGAARGGVQAVDVLGDHRVEQRRGARARPARGARRWAACRRGSRSAARRSPRTSPDRAARRRCGRPPSGRRSPTGPVCGERKSGIPDGTEIPAPVSATTEPAERISPASSAAALTCPLNLGVRLPRKAEMPSRASSDVKASMKPPFSASMPSSRSPACETRLICSSATGAWRANLRAPVERGVEQLVVGHDRVDEAVLERLARRRSARPSCSSRAPSPARRAAAAAGCRRSRG